MVPASAPAPAAHPALAAHEVRIDLTARGHVFRPDEALGAAFDGGVRGGIDQNLTPHNIAAMKRLGLRPLTYRLRTELGIEAWHWNPVGRWSDPAKQQGYWTSSDRLGPPIGLSWGYKLPRRGDSIDNANETEWSRLTDGDPATFWKSNPYLDPSVVRDGRPHAQWLQIRLPAAAEMDAIGIDWAEPFATRYAVQYWVGTSLDDQKGRWITFPRGMIKDGRGGKVRLDLTDRPVSARYVRILMLESSGTAPPGSHDWRDRKGYAVGEVYLGRKTAGGLNDQLTHLPDPRRQSFTHVSSTDPWHRAIDRDIDLEQAGIDRIFRSGLASGRPVMTPVGLLFDTPDNAAAELRYLRRRRYPVREVELGEEPDGQYAAPEDYGALYVAAARRLKGILPGARFGGPSLQSYATTTVLQPEAPAAWTAGFLAYLRDRGRMADLGFVSFEYYPVETMCGDINAALITQTAWLKDAVRTLRADGTPKATPLIITEYGLSAHAGRAMSELPSALLMGQIVGEWLQLGGKAAYMFGYPPNTPFNQTNPCAGFGNMTPFIADGDGQARTPTPTYYAARLLTGVWTQPGHGAHRSLPAEVTDMPGDEVRAYAVRRPDGRLAVMAINRSRDRRYRLTLAVRRKPGGGWTPLQGPARISAYGPDQYAWIDAGPDSAPLRSLPPVTGQLGPGPMVLDLGPDSLAVIVEAPPRRLAALRKGA